MSREKIYALLDADFIIKAMIAQKSRSIHLLDWLVSNSCYQFVCHEMTMQKISKHDLCGATTWVKAAIASGKVTLYTDKLLLAELCKLMGLSGIQMYKNFLQISCNSMSADFYTKNYTSIDTFDLSNGIDLFLAKLFQCDKEVGPSQSLGEIKAMTLPQWLQYFYPEKVYMFCSDDRKARIGLYSVTSVPCKSIMSIFWDMKK